MKRLIVSFIFLLTFCLSTTIVVAEDAKVEKKPDTCQLGLVVWHDAAFYSRAGYDPDSGDDLLVQTISIGCYKLVQTTLVVVNSMSGKDQRPDQFTAIPVAWVDRIIDLAAKESKDAH